MSTLSVPRWPPPGAATRLALHPWGFPATVVAFTVAGLALDRAGDLGLQLALSAAAWTLLAWAMAASTPLERAQTVVVIVVATMGEVLGSLILGIYEYRLGNLPLFVPAGHGLVYLTGLRLSQTGLALRRPRLWVGLALAGLVAWAAIGLAGVPRSDVAGAVGAALLAVFLIKGRAPTVYAGVFMFVAFLELYGTAVGTWRWAEHIPYLGVPDGNPPSGAACGYVLFDIAALTFAPALLRTARRARVRIAAHPAFARQS